MISLHVVLVGVAFIVTIAAATGRAPLWVAVILLALAELVQVWPR